MHLVALLPCRNEDYIIGLSLRALLAWVDQVVVLLHASTDRSAEIVEAIASEYPGRVTILTEDDPTWNEMPQRHRMLQTARDSGATHIVTLDADEVLTANLVPRIRPLIEQLPRQALLNLPGYNLRSGMDRYHANGIWANRWFSSAFVDHPQLNWSGDQFHHRAPMGLRQQHCFPILQGQGGVLHFWGASERRLRAKHRLYVLTERIRWPEHSVAQYSLWEKPGPGEVPWTFAQVPPSWLEFGSLLEYVQLDAEPWQERYCQRLIEERGIEMFAGLNLFGDPMSLVA